MAKAIKCDRCGRYTDYDEKGEKPQAPVYQMLPDVRMSGNRDVCERCKKEFEQWWGQPREDKLRRIAYGRDMGEAGES